MTFGSLFAGIGGMDLGLERAGMECRWQVEIDPFCRKVLAKHWPDVKRYEDVRTVDWAGVERVDLIAGGFPCQDISSAGKRAGIEAARSGLWSEYERAVRILRPCFVLVENVSALLERGMGRVVGDLAEIGYDAEWTCIPAAAVGAPHIRDRAFILAYPAGLFWTALVGSEPDGDLSSHAYSRILADAYRASGPERKGERENLIAKLSPAQRSLRSSRAWDGGPFDDGALDDGLSCSVAALDGFGNAVVPQVAEWIGRRILATA